MTSDSRNASVTVTVLAFAAGFAMASSLRFARWKQRKAYLREHAGATTEGNDHSFVYFDTEEEKDMLVGQPIPPHRRFLPKELYGQWVRDSIVCCVDIVLVRTRTRTVKRQRQRHLHQECLLVERGTEPVKGAWWFPGGRIYRGETFFTAALRKMREETGIASEDARCVQVLGVYNTFFPTSEWDTPEAKGTQTVNALVLVMLPPTTSSSISSSTTRQGGKAKAQDVLLDATSERFKWIGLDPEEAVVNGEDRYVVEGLRRLDAWNQAYGGETLKYGESL